MSAYYESEDLKKFPILPVSTKTWAINFLPVMPTPCKKEL